MDLGLPLDVGERSVLLQQLFKGQPLVQGRPDHWNSQALAHINFMVYWCVQHFRTSQCIGSVPVGVVYLGSPQGRPAILKAGYNK